MPLKRSYFPLILCIFIFSLSMSCSSGPQEEIKTDKNRMDQLTSETADKIIDHVQTPINSAKDVTDMANQQSDRMKKMTEEIKNE